MVKKLTSLLFLSLLFADSSFAVGLSRYTGVDNTVEKIPLIAKGGKIVNTGKKKEKGFDNILLLTGEAKKKFSVQKIAKAVEIAKKYKDE